jgi:hypothetical protein
MLGESVSGAVPDQTTDLSANQWTKTPPKVKKVKGNRSSTRKAKAGMMRRRQRTTAQADTVTPIPHAMISPVLVRWVPVVVRAENWPLSMLRGMRRTSAKAHLDTSNTNRRCVSLAKV